MNARSLAAVQERLQRHILEGGDACAADIGSRGALSAERGLAIYHHAYRMRLVEAMRDAHGHTARHLGDEFDILARRYVEDHASSHASLRHYGRDFAGWLAGHLPDRPALAELAALDEALRTAFDGADSPALALEDLATLDPEAWSRIVLVPVPTLARLRHSHNTLETWQAIDNDTDPPPSRALENAIEIVIWRRGLQPHFRSLAAYEAAALDLTRSGASFAATCDRLAERFPEEDAAQEIGRVLRRWVDEELLAGVR